MIEKLSAFGLALFASAALANPVGGAVNGLLGGLKGGANGSASGVALPALPMSFNALGQSATAAPRAGGASILPGLGNAATEGPLGVTVLQEGADGSGYDYVLHSEQLQPLYALNPVTNDAVSSTVLNGVTTALFQEELVTDGTLLDNDHLIDDGLDNNLVTPLLGLDGDGGFVDVAIFDGNGTANAGNLGIAIGSGSFTGNGGDIGIGIANDGFSGNGGAIGIGIANQGPVSGNGGDIGIGILSGEASGNGGVLGIGLLNTNDPLHICGMGTCGGLNDVWDASGPEPLIDQMGLVIGGGSNAQTSGASNPLLNIGLLTGDNVGNGGLIGLGVIAGDNSANSGLLGVCILCGDNVANTSDIAVAALAGDNAANSDYNNTTSNFSVNVAALAGDNSGGSSAGTSDIGVAALSGDNSGNGGTLGVGAISGGNSGNSGFPGTGLGVGAVNAGGGGGGTAPPPSEPSGGGSANMDSAADEGFCALEVRDGKGRVVQTIKRPCKQLASARRSARS